ncbi:MAG: hypothetical protein IJA97_01850 [Clostridia bacterium]|nr:hypothetical protein [Clostridia bacterium]
MNCYFLSDVLSHLKIDGEYAGTVYLNPLYLKAETQPSLVEFLPTSRHLSPVYFSPNTQELSGLRVENGLLFYPQFSQKNDFSFKLIFQQKYHSSGGEITLTVVEDGSPKFYLDGAIYSVKSLPFTPEQSTAEFYGEYLAVSFFKKKTALFLFNLHSGELLFSDIVDEFYLTDVLTVKKSYKTVTETVITEAWELGHTARLKSVSDEKGKELLSLNRKLLPLAFFENAIIGARVDGVCTAEFAKNSSNLREFLGSVKKVLPSPTCDSAVWLIGGNCVTNATLSYKNGLIDNVFLDDF